MEKQTTELEKAKSLALKKFEGFIEGAKELHQQALAIVVKDETTLAMATQVLSKINDLHKKTEAKRKELKAPYLDMGRTLDAAADLVLSPLKDGLEKGKAKIKIWNDEQVAIAKEKEEKNARFKAFMEGAIALIQAKSELCDTAEKCDSLIKSIRERFPADDKFGPYAKEANSIKERYLAELYGRKIHLINNPGNAPEVLKESAEATKEISSAAEEAINEVKEEVADQLSAATTKSAVRKTWKYRIKNEEDIPREWLTLDTTKAAAYLSANRESMVSGTVINGIEFYQEENVTIR